jgi:uncharacterized protein
VHLTSAVRIGRPAPEVLDALLDPGKVAACLPGSRLIGEVDEGTYAGELQLRIGLVDTVYAGTVHLDSADRAAGTARLRASGQERSGRGRADAQVTLRVESHGVTTRVLISADLMLHGAVSQYAAGAIGDVGQRLVEQFAGNVERLLAAQAEQGVPAGAIPGAAGAVPGSAGGRPGWAAGHRVAAGRVPRSGAGRAPEPGPGWTAGQKRTAAVATLLAAGVVAGVLAARAAWRRHGQVHTDPVIPLHLWPEGARHG